MNISSKEPVYFKRQRIWKIYCAKTKLVTIFVTDPTVIYLFKVINGNTRWMCEICSKSATKTSEKRQRSRSGAFIVTIEQVHIFFWCFHWRLWTSKCRLGNKTKNNKPWWKIQENQSREACQKSCHTWGFL